MKQPAKSKSEKKETWRDWETSRVNGIIQIHGGQGSIRTLTRDSGRGARAGPPKALEGDQRVTTKPNDTNQEWPDQYKPRS